MNILQKIQSELKAPKGQMNKFGNYKYRSCEDIVEAVKPLLKSYGASLTLSDEIVQIGDRYYVKATACLRDGVAVAHNDKIEMVPPICVTAYAREQESKKGMDEAQITGSASSYARKYALNGLLAIDDTKDADTMKPADNEGHRFKPGEKEEIVKQVLQALDDGDEQGLKQILAGYESPEEKMKVWALFNSSQRAAIKELTA